MDEVSWGEYNFIHELVITCDEHIGINVFIVIYILFIGE